MIKTKTVGGESAYRIKLEIIFTLSNFAIALGEQQFHNKNINFKTLKKKKALEILYKRLSLFGRRGEYNIDESIGCDHMQEYNECYLKAKQWVIKNYPYLKQHG